MNEKTVDLHIHTNFSDGSYSPAKIVNFARKVGLSAIAITDHDITDGIIPAINEGKELGIEVVPGVELSCEKKQSADGEMHILGYYGNWESVEFQDELELFRKARIERASKIIGKLRKLKMLLDEKEILKKADKTSIGRMHIAKLLVSEGFVGNIKECFNKYLAYGKPAYYPKRKINPKNAIKLILNTGGIPVIAHPIFGANSKEIVTELKDYGLMGIEAYASRHNPKDIEKYLEWAKELDLLVTGGSDFHYSPNNDTGILGKIKVNYDAVINLKKAIQ